MYSIFVGALAVLILGFIGARHLGPNLRTSAASSHQLAVVGALLSAVCVTSLGLLSRMILVKANVYNFTDSLVLRKREVPGFVYQDRHSSSLFQFRQHIDEVLQVNDVDSLSKVVALRHWVRCQQSEAKAAWVTERAVDHEDPHLLLQELRSGEPGACRRFAYILLGAVLSAGFDARFVVFASRLRRRRVLFHAVVEVWIEEMDQWVLLDPTYDCIVLIHGKLASAIDLVRAVESGDPSSIVFERNGSLLKPVPKIAFLNQCCRHLFLARSNAIFDGYGVRMFGPKRIDFLHYSPCGTKYPNGSKQLLIGLTIVCAVVSIAIWTLSVVAWTFE